MSTAAETDKTLLANYVTENSLREPDVLKELREYTVQNVPRSVMLSDVLPTQLLRMLLKLTKAKKCLEVGTYTGYNALNCALTIPKDGKVYALDLNEDFVKHGYPFFDKANVRDKLNVIIGPAIQSMDTLIEDGNTGTFDFVYIDAHKPEYKDYLERAYVLLRPEGIIAVDNTLQEGRVAKLDSEMSPRDRENAESVDKFNRSLKDDKRFDISFLNIDDGVTILYKL